MDRWIDRRIDRCRSLLQVSDRRPRTFVIKRSACFFLQELFPHNVSDEAAPIWTDEEFQHAVDVLAEVRSLSLAGRLFWRL
jgi:hypothetical protein